MPLEICLVILDESLIKLYYFSRFQPRYPKRVAKQIVKNISVEHWKSPMPEFYLTKFFFRDCFSFFILPLMRVIFEMLSNSPFAKYLHFHPFFALKLSFYYAPTVVAIFEKFNLCLVLSTWDPTHLYISLALFFLFQCLLSHIFYEGRFLAFDPSLEKFKGCSA